MNQRRRALLLAPLLAAPLLATLARPSRAAAPIRIGTLRYGTVAWELDVMRHHGLAAASHLHPAAQGFLGLSGEAGRQQKKQQQGFINR